MEVDFVVQGFDRTVGLSRYSESLIPELRNHCEVNVVRPRFPDVAKRALSPLGDPETFFSSYPLAYGELTGDILHLSAQTLTIPLLYAKDRPTVVTVHDIFPYMLPRMGFRDPDPWYDRAMYRLAMAGLKRADHIIANSNATKESLIEWLDIPEERITTVYLGVDHETFKPMPVPEEIYEQYGLNPDDKHVLYVGSETKRKSVPELVSAFADILDEIPNATLIKVGGPQHPNSRERTMAAVQEYNIEDRVVFTGYVPEEDLPYLYNLTDVFASASKFEGFGFPFVEAMACGTPVIGYDRTTGPELISKGGFLVDDLDQMVATLCQLLTEQSVSEWSENKPKINSKIFNWRSTVNYTYQIYESVVD